MSSPTQVNYHSEENELEPGGNGGHRMIFEENQDDVT